MLMVEMRSEDCIFKMFFLKGDDQLVIPPTANLSGILVGCLPLHHSHLSLSLSFHLKCVFAKWNLFEACAIFGFAFWRLAVHFLQLLSHSKRNLVLYCQNVCIPLYCQLVFVKDYEMSRLGK